MKHLYIKFYILYHYGGLWLENSTICFTNLKNVFDLLKTQNLILFDCDKNEINCNIMSNDSLFSIACNKNNRIIQSILELIINESKDFIDNFNMELKIQNIINLNKKYIYHLYNLSRDYKNKVIHIENLISHNYTIINNSNKLLFLVIDINYIKKYTKYHWLLRLSKQQILNSNMWISKLFRYALHMEQTVYRYNNLYKNSLIENEIKLVPDNMNELKNIITNYNLYQEYPYRLVHKQPIRNT